MKKLHCIFFLLLCCISAAHAQSDIITTIAGVDTVGYCCDGELAIDAELDAPFSLKVDRYNNIYFTDGFNQRIRRIDNVTGIITTIAGTGVAGYTGDSGLAINAKLFLPEGIIFDANDNIYFSDAENNVIRRIDATTNIITTIAGNGSAGSSGDNGLAINAELNKPCGLFFDKFGSLIFADEFNNKIRKIDTTTGIIVTIAGTGSLGYSGNNSPATGATLHHPGQVTTDSNGNVIFSDTYNSVVRKIVASTGIITTIAGSSTTGFFGDGGPAINAGLYLPIGLFIDQQQNIFIADDENGAVRKIDAASGIITTVAGTGVPGYSGNGGPATNAQIIPTDVYFNSGGDMFIADAGNYCIRRVQSGLGTHNLIKLDVVNIYPNPTAGKFVIETAADNDQISIEITNIVGNTVYNSLTNTPKTEIDISPQPPGIYMLHLTNPTTGERLIRKIVKE